MNRTYQTKPKKSAYILTLQTIVTLITAFELIWIVASYINIIQYNMGSCEYAAWNLITKMF